MEEKAGLDQQGRANAAEERAGGVGEYSLEFAAGFVACFGRRGQQGWWSVAGRWME